MSEDSHGRLLKHEFVRARELASCRAIDLGVELLARLRAPLEHASFATREEFLAMLNELGDAVESRREDGQNRYSMAIQRDFFGFVGHCCVHHGVPMRDAVHLEIGCGAVNPFGRLFAHLLLGARRGIAVELEPQRDAPAGARFLAKLAATAWVEPRRIYGDFPVDRAAMTANLAGFDLAKLACGDVAGLAPDRLELRLEPIESMGLPTGSVDVVLSSSVLEHLSDVDAALRELRRVTRPGGFGIHGVDTIDHWWYGHPEQHALEFLTVDAAEAMVHGSNRLRLHELDARFAAHGFTVLERWPYNKVAITPQLRGRLREPWRSMPDELLDTTWCQYLLRRDGSP